MFCANTNTVGVANERTKDASPADVWEGTPKRPGLRYLARVERLQSMPCKNVDSDKIVQGHKTKQAKEVSLANHAEKLNG